MANKGYIYLHRQLLDSAIWNTSERFNLRSAWIDLLLIVNHADNKMFVDGTERIIHRGQTLTSVRKLSQRWRVTDKTTRRWLDVLQSAGMIAKDSTKRYTLITVLKYAEYQDISAFKGKQSTTVSTEQSPQSVPQYVRTDYLQTINVINDNECIKNENEIKRREPAPPNDGGEWQ